MNESKRAGGIDERGRRTLGRFLHESDGFAITLTIISLPFVLAIAAWVIDASRVGNLHTDLQHAVDAMALAGARELDGRDDAIPRAQNAIMGLDRNFAVFAGGGAGTSMGSQGTNVVYDPADDDASTVWVRFLKSLPDSDDEPIDLSEHEVNAGTIAEQSNQALYAYVIAKKQSMQTIFPLALAGRQTVQVGAEAVATYHAAACDVTPLWICNPFEPDDINEKFSQGAFYGRLLTMQISGPSTAFPGNFGFLAVGGTGGDVLGEALATGDPDACYEEDGVTTEPGATWGQARPGLNVRMGLYQGPQNSNRNSPRHRPAKNVRKGAENPNSCSDYSEASNLYDTMAFPNGDGDDIVLGGGTESESSDWNIDLYWDVNHSGQNPHPLETYSDYLPPPAPVDEIRAAVSSHPSGTTPANVTPSRYDVYQYEMMTGSVPDAAPNGETGVPQCGYDPNGITDDRRIVFAAVVNCNALEAAGGVQGRSDLPVEAFASMFMVKPADEPCSGCKSIPFEVVDVTGAGGRGTLETFLREEAELVR